MKDATYIITKERSGLYWVKISFIYDGKRYRRALGISLDNRQQWNNKTNRVQSRVVGSFENNRLLDLYEKRIKDLFYDSLRLGFKINDTLIKAKVFNSDEAADKTQNTTFIDFIKREVAARSQDPAFKPSTVKKYNSLIIALLEYESLNDCQILFHDITADFIDSFKDYLYKVRKVNNATLGKYLAKIRTFARLASKAKMPIPDDYKDLKIKDYKAYNIYLTISELSTLYKHKYPSHRLRNAVDLFCIGAFTGLRFGDVYSLKQENIKEVNGKDMIYLQQEKTGHDPIIIPLHHIVKDIITRNKGIPTKISNQKLNDYIKEAARIAGLTKDIIHYYNKAGKDTSIVMPKCDLITTHTARRSMITNMVIQGIPNSLIMKISGHRTESAFRRYLCLENEQAAILLSDHDFFK